MVNVCKTSSNLINVGNVYVTNVYLSLTRMKRGEESTPSDDSTNSPSTVCRLNCVKSSFQTLNHLLQCYKHFGYRNSNGVKIYLLNKSLEV